MERIPTYLTPALGNRFSDWLRILNTAPVAPKYWHRVLAIGSITFLSAPFQWYEDVRLRRRLQETQIHPAPVFIIGHWRSGTTFLHNLLSQDEQFGFVTTVQSVFPHSFMTNPLFPYLTKVLMPPTRPMDDMRLFMRSPQEEEMAMVNYGPYSFYHAWHFPSRIREYYHRMLTLENLDEEERRGWRLSYLNLLTKTTLNWGGRRLLLKSPTNTGRLRTLLELFPNARFIFIHRDPLEVYPSTQKLYRNVLPVFQLEDYDFDRVKKDIIWVYKKLMRNYLEQRLLIPRDQLYEVAHLDMIKSPMDHLEKMYECLDLGDFSRVAGAFQSYLDKKGIKDYKKSTYTIPPEELPALKREWDFALERWGKA